VAVRRGAHTGMNSRYRQVMLSFEKLARARFTATFAGLVQDVIYQIDDTSIVS